MRLSEVDTPRLWKRADAAADWPRGTTVGPLTISLHLDHRGVALRRSFGWLLRQEVSLLSSLTPTPREPATATIVADASALSSFHISTLDLVPPATAQNQLALTVEPGMHTAAVKLVRQLHADVAAVTSQRGPLAPPSTLDTRLHGSRAVQDIAGPLGNAVGVLAGLGAALGLLFDGGQGAAVAAAVAAIAGGWGVFATTADIRLRKAAEKRAADLYRTKDVDQMTRALRAAPPTVQALVQGALPTIFNEVNGSLRLPATVHLEGIRAAIAATPADPSHRRVARLAENVAKLLERVPADRCIDDLRLLLAEANEAERREIGAALHEALFDKDENGCFVGSQVASLELTRLVARAARGLAPEVPTETSQPALG